MRLLLAAVIACLFCSMIDQGATSALVLTVLVYLAARAAERRNRE